MIVYLSGINEESNIKDIDSLKIDLLSLGCTVISPDDKELYKLSWSENLRLRLSFIQRSSTIYMLPDWKESVMARIELTAAMDDKKPFCFSPEEIKDLLTTLDG